MMFRLLLLAAMFIGSGLLIDASSAGADELRDDTEKPCPYAKGKHHDPESVFAEMDRDGSGDISADEFVAYHEDMLRKKFARIDDDGDGKVSKTELKLHHEQMKNKRHMMHEKGEGQHPEKRRRGDRDDD